jgi:hypothetical protein
VRCEVGLDGNPKRRLRNPNSGGSINGRVKRIYLFSKGSRVALGPTQPLINVLLGGYEVREKKNAYKSLVVEPEGKGALGSLRSRWECNTERSLQEIIWEVVWGLGHVPQGSYQQHTVANT